MPEHIHLLIQRRTGARGTPSTVMQVLKQRVSRQLRRKQRASAAQLHLRFGRSDDALPRSWQLRFHDFNVWSHKKRVESSNTWPSESSEARLGGAASQGLALEQLLVLCEPPATGPEVPIDPVQ